MKNTILLSLLLLTALLEVHAQRNVKSFTVVSYNVENLFDTVDAPGVADESFTPGGEKAWDWDRYRKKLRDLSGIIADIPGKELPALVALSEIENRQVLEDLIGRRALRRGDYQIVHEDGDDPRGIECALLYRPEFFTLKEYEYLEVTDSRDPDYLLRSILHVSGKAADGKALHIFVNHWKSRSGGQMETEGMRLAAALVLRRKLDMLMSRDRDFRAIILGDFNDEPTNNSLMRGLSAGNKRRNVTMGEYYNLFYDLHNAEGRGTYNYQGTWNMLDQIIVSYNLLNQSGRLSTGFGGGRILKDEKMLYESEKYGEMLPSATYGGPQYYGGPSDHLPVYVEFTW